MALARLFDFTAGTIIQSGQVDSELNQLVNYLKGGGGQHANNFTAVNNSGTGETDLHSFTLPANFFGADGDMVSIKFGGSVAANANQKRIRLYVAGTVIYDSGSTSGLNNVKWNFEFEVSRIDSDSVRIVGRFFAGDYFVGPAANTTGGTGFITCLNADVNSLTFSSTQIVKVTGQSAVGSNDVTQNYSTLKKFTV
jgi:hypothetical protein